LVYCLEEHELGAAPQLFTADTEAEPVVEFKPDLLEGVNTITVPGFLTRGDTDDLYGEHGSLQQGKKKAVLIPYFAWCNRGPSHMQVWVAEVAAGGTQLLQS
jgi:uncharacterized protein